MCAIDSKSGNAGEAAFPLLLVRFFFLLSSFLLFTVASLSLVALATALSLYQTHHGLEQCVAGFDGFGVCLVVGLVIDQVDHLRGQVHI